MYASNFIQNKVHIFIVICMKFYMNFDGMILTFYTWIHVVYTSTSAWRPFTTWTQKLDFINFFYTVLTKWINYRLITAYLLLRVNLDKIMHTRWDFDASSARTQRVSALDKHQNWSASALFCQNSRAQSKYAVVNLIHTRRKQTFLSFIMW